MLKRVILVHNKTTDPKLAFHDRVKGFLQRHDTEVVVSTVEGRGYPQYTDAVDDADMIIVLGGDGTVLRSARMFAEKQVPIVGINMGKLGFLTRIDSEHMDEYLERLMSGDYRLEDRTMIEINTPCIESDKTELALNDVLVKNANPSQMGSFNLYINDTPVASYDADGVIIATPTGSTAYTLSAGGPVISPEVEAFSVTPICPHSLSAKPFVIPAFKVIRVESITRNTQLVVSVDGHESCFLKKGESIVISQAEVQMKFVAFHPEEEDFYRLLREKLFWSMNPRWKT